MRSKPRISTNRALSPPHRPGSGPRSAIRSRRPSSRSRSIPYQVSPRRIAELSRSPHARKRVKPHRNNPYSEPRRPRKPLRHPCPTRNATPSARLPARLPRRPVQPQCHIAGNGKSRRSQIRRASANPPRTTRSSPAEDMDPQAPGSVKEPELQAGRESTVDDDVAGEPDEQARERSPETGSGRDDSPVILAPANDRRARYPGRARPRSPPALSCIAARRRCLPIATCSIFSAMPICKPSNRPAGCPACFWPRPHALGEAAREGRRTN